MQILYFIQQNLNTGEFSLIHHSVFYEQHKIKEFSTSNMGFMEGLCQFMQEYYPKFPPAEIIQTLDVEQLMVLYPEEPWVHDIFLRFIKDLDDEATVARRTRDELLPLLLSGAVTVSEVAA